MKKIIYIDLDNTMSDYLGAAKELNVEPKDAKHIIGFFRNLKPMEGAIESYNELAKYFDVYILSTSPWSMPNALMEKLEWVKKYLPNAYKNVIFSHHKDLNIGDYLIDDLTKNGAGEFTGEHIQIYSDKFPNWESVIKYIFEKENIK
jgi:5'(3')-deoxyribonucleotidase